MAILDTLVEVTIAQREDFLKIIETLTRIGVASAKSRKFYQSCHILHKQGRYFIVHFKELFALDGKPTDFSDDDRARRNTIAALLDEWGLVKIVSVDLAASPRAPMSQVKVLPFKEKANWILEAKYNIGRKKV